MSDNSVTPVAEHRRKRVRKGTKSCWECKRRKIKCVYQSEDNSTCAGCLDKGTTCLSQEYVDDQSPHEGSQALGQRMGRVEAMLEKLVEKVTAVTEEPQRTAYGIDILTPSSTSATSYDTSTPFMTLFDDVVPQQSDATTGSSVSKSFGQMPPPSVSNASTPSGCQAPYPHKMRVEKLQRRLAAMLPCQDDIDYLSELSHGWWLVRSYVIPHLLRNAGHDLSRPFNVEVVSASHPMIIARLLLCIALCIQQLPRKFESTRLQSKIPLLEMMERITITVSTVVTSDDELIGSMEGIECLILQGMFQINAGNLRRSWLAFRRAINVAQLMGLHRASSKPDPEGNDMMETRRHFLWFQLMKVDTYLSLMLGTPSATGSTAFPFDDNALWLSTEDRYQKQLCHLSGMVLARNLGDSTHAFSITQEIDEKLDALAKQMSRTWWEVPATNAPGRTQDVASQFDRLHCQIWHFELETLAHLPFMLRATTDRRYEYSRISCLSASRGLIRRWIFIREAHSSIVVCNAIEFQAFTAAITLLLGLFGLSFNSSDPSLLREHMDDLELVEEVVQILEGSQSSNTGSNVASQSISVIRTLQRVLRNECNGSASLRLSIPHFGTISIARSGISQSINGERILGAAPCPSDESTTSLGLNSPLRASRSTPSSSYGTNTNTNPWQVTPIAPHNSSVSVPSNSGYHSLNGSDVHDDGETMNGNPLMKQPMLQFTSSQFPIFETSNLETVNAEWPFEESDILLFDSLLHTDLEGNWDF